jgi:hypothetical protein
MFARQWWPPLATVIALGYFLVVYRVGMHDVPHPFIDAVSMPGRLALLLGAPLVAPFGMTIGSWSNGTPTDAGCQVLIVLYTIAIWVAARLLSAVGAR